MDAILVKAHKHGIPVVEFVAQAIGSEHKGRKADSMGLIGRFSFREQKSLPTLGDAS